MFLKSLALKGFKSFADSTNMVLESGVTVVVGPNGSGKSNVVDAMAWVLGAQSPKAVRSQKMDDVIFAGTATRPALGRAEVSITIDNSDGTLGVEFNEVTITRVLFRTGESEYLINGVTCRLLDVQEMLSDAGVGRQQHVIVSQGQIDAVLNARPEERRAIIEEAAGVLKFRKRKEKAERRLDATEANLLRVQDLLREVRRQLRPLERQAKAAERHGSLIVELTDLKTFVAGREIAGLRTKLESLAAVKIDSSTAEQELKSALAGLDTAVMAIEAQLSARGASDVSDQLVRVEQLRERARGLSAVLVERRRSLERDKGQLIDAGVVANLEADAARFRTELIDVIAELDTFEPAAAELEAEEQAFHSERSQVLDAVGADQPAAKAASAAAEVRGEARSVKAALERSLGDLRRATSRHESLTERLQLAAEEAARFRAECDEAGSVEGPLFDQLAAAEDALAAAEAVVEAARAERAEAADAASTATARVEALQMALDAARARAGAERLQGVDGVLGTLLELIEIDTGWEAAVEAALGESLTAVVVSDPGSARSALDALRSSDTSGAVIALGSQFSTHGPVTSGPARAGPCPIVEWRCQCAPRRTARRCRQDRRPRRGARCRHRPPGSGDRHRDRRPLRAQRLADRVSRFRSDRRGARRGTGAGGRRVGPARTSRPGGLDRRRRAHRSPAQRTGVEPPPRRERRQADGGVGGSGAGAGRATRDRCRARVTRSHDRRGNGEQRT